MAGIATDIASGVGGLLGSDLFENPLVKEIIKETTDDLRPFIFGTHDDDEDMYGAFEKKAAKVAGAAAEKAAEWLNASLFNAASVHKGSSAEMIMMFNQNATRNAWNLAKAASDPNRDDLFELLSEAGIGDPELIEVVPEPQHAMYKEYIKNQEMIAKGLKTPIEENYIRLATTFDQSTGTLYVSWPASSRDSLYSQKVGPAFSNVKLKTSEFKFNSTGGKVSTVMQEAYEVTRPTLQSLMEKHQPYNIVFAGHSQGAIMSTMANADELFSNKNITTYAFAPGVVGDSKFIEGLKKNAGNANIDYNRIMHKKDPVSYIGNFRHPSNEVWDISNDLVTYESLLADDLEKYTDDLGNITKKPGIGELTHREAGLDLAFRNIEDGIGVPMFKKGKFVFKGKFGALLKFVHKVNVMTAWDVYTAFKYIVDVGGAKYLDTFKKHAPKIGLEIADSFKKVLIKAGFNPATGRIVKNALTDVIMKRLDVAVLSHLKSFGKETFNSMVEYMTKSEKTHFFDLVDGKVPYTELTEATIGNKKIGNIVGELSSEMVELINKTPGLSDIYGSYHAFDDDFVQQGNEFLFDSKAKLNMGQTIKKSKQVAVQFGESAAKAIGKAAENGQFKTKVMFDDAIGASSDAMKKKMAQLTARYRKAMAIYLDTVYGSDRYRALEDFPKPTVLNSKLKSIGIDIAGVVKKQVGELFTRLGKSVGVSGVDGFKKAMNGLSDEALAASKQWLKKLGASKGKVWMGKIGRYLAKEMPILSPALEVGFTTWEITSDLERIEDEKEYIAWNGELVFKLYNPEEYQQLVMMDLVYQTLDLDVSYDDFVNTWYGRLTSDENGVLSIDGIPTNNPDFDIVYDTSVVKARDRSNYEGESKTLSVLKNVGLGVFNLALDLGSFMAPSASAIPGITTAIVDEVFEQQAIGVRENGFKNALKVKFMNDDVASFIDQVMKTDGREALDGSNPKALLNGHIWVQSARVIMKEYFKLYFLQEQGNFSEFSEETIKKKLTAISASLEKAGFPPDIMKDGVHRVAHNMDLYDQDSDAYAGIALTVFNILKGFGGGAFDLVGGAVDIMGNFDLTRRNSNVNELLRVQGDSMYQELLNNVNLEQDGTSEKTSFYDQAYADKVNEIKRMYQDQLDIIWAKKKNGDYKGAGRDDYYNAQQLVHAKWILNMKFLDLSVNRNSKYKDDPDIVEMIEKERGNQLKVAMERNVDLNKTLNVLLEKHSGVGTTVDLREEMRIAIAKTHIDYLLHVSGNTGNTRLADILMRFYKKNTDGSGREFQWKPDELRYISSMGINGKDLDMLKTEQDNASTMNAENMIREQYIQMSKILDVFYDSRSPYRSDPSVIEYFNLNGINIDPEARVEERIESLREYLGSEYEKHLKQVTDDLLNNMKERDVEMTEFYEGQFDDLVKKIQELEAASGQTRDADGNLIPMDLTVMDGRVVMRTLDQEAPALTEGNQTDVLGEFDQMDKGYADEGVDDKSKFTPSGKILPFTINNGIPRMLFEDGTEKTYTGPKNALVGNLSAGFWVGPIPKGDHAPINTIDNFYMAFHIEHQEDPLIARLRLMSRITTSLNKKEMSVSKNIVEYNIAIATLMFLEENNDIYGIDIDSVLLNDGVGAELNMQLHESSNELRKGALPDGIDFSSMDISIEDDIVNPLKRAADIALEIGDEMMATKFRKISVERDDMERVAHEYLGNVKDAMGGSKNINPLQRLVLEELSHQDTLKTQYTNILIETLGKKLIDFV